MFPLLVSPLDTRTQTPSSCILWFLVAEEERKTRCSVSLAFATCCCLQRDSETEHRGETLTGAVTRRHPAWERYSEAGGAEQGFGCGRSLLAAGIELCFSVCSSVTGFTGLGMFWKGKFLKDSEDYFSIRLKYVHMIMSIMGEYCYENNKLMLWYYNNDTRGCINTEHWQTQFA